MALPQETNRFMKNSLEALALIKDQRLRQALLINILSILETSFKDNIKENEVEFLDVIKQIKPGYLPATFSFSLRFKPGNEHEKT